AGKGSTASHAAAIAVAGRGSDIVTGQRIHRDRERSIMQTENRLFDDMARVASGALSGFTGLKQEIEARIREQVERLLRDMDLVTREEFEAVKAVAQTARAEQERLAARVAA